MKNSDSGLSCAQAKEIDLVAYLSLLGHQVKKISGVNYWYLSPLREEKTPSFKVDRRRNLWYDHGLGKGGTIIDFGLLYFNCSIGGLLQKLAIDFSFHQPLFKMVEPAGEDTEKTQINPSQSLRLNDNKDPGNSNESVLNIQAVSPLTSLPLQRYVHTRNIPLPLACKWLKEVEFSIAGRPYKALGFLNASGGYELRSERFKGSSTPKDVTKVDRGGKSLAVFEGFFDFLSFLSCYKQGALLEGCFLVLNSLSFIEKSLPYLASFQRVSLFLDRDAPGRKQTESLLALSSKYSDESGLYNGYKDLNEWTCSMGKRWQRKQGPGIR